MIKMIKRLFEPSYVCELERQELRDEHALQNLIFMEVFTKLAKSNPHNPLTVELYRQIVDIWNSSRIFSRYHFPVVSDFSGKNFDWAHNISPMVAVLLAGNNIIVPLESVKIETIVYDCA